MVLPTLGIGLISEAIVIAIIALVLFVILKLGKTILRLVFGIIINSIVGLMLLLLLDGIFKFKIAISLALLVPVAIFGLPATGTIVLLKLLNVSV